MRLFDASHHDDAELLERHVLTQLGDASDPALWRFRSVHPALILVTNSMLGIFRARLRGDPSETERWLAAVKPRLGGRLEWQNDLPFGQPKVSAVGPKSLRWNISKGHTLRRGVRYGATSAIAAILLLAGWVTVARQYVRRASPAMAMYATANGERATITLTDGSTVMLDVASRLWVPADYAAGDRTVRLVGEAFFTVSHHGGTPFVVVAGPTATRVLGTSFVVRRYGTDTVTMVAVSSGKVAVGTAVVTPNRLVEVGPRGIVQAVPADAAQFSFTTGVLELRNMTLSQAIPELDRWYDADIRLADAALATKPIEGDVSAGSLVDLMERLTLIFNVHVVRDGRVLTLYPR